MKVRKYPIPKGKVAADVKIHSGTLVGDIGFGLIRVLTDCGLEFDDWVEVIVKEATCERCRKGKR